MLRKFKNSFSAKYIFCDIAGIDKSSNSSNIHTNSTKSDYSFRIGIFDGIHSTCCIIYGVWHDAVVIDCSATRFSIRWPEVFAITTMESRKVNDKIFISGMVIRGQSHGGNPFSARPPRAETTSKICPDVGARAHQFRILIVLSCGTVIVLYLVVILTQRL